METSQLICRANQVTGLYMMGTLVAKRLIISSKTQQSFFIRQKSELHLAFVCLWFFEKTEFGKVLEFWD